jgi:hypothetical protein
MLADLETRRKKLREERENFDLMTCTFILKTLILIAMESSFEQSKTRVPKRALPGRVVPGGPGSAYYDDGMFSGLGPTRRGGYGSGRGRGRQAGLAAPLVPVVLRDQEVHEDLSALRKVSCSL